MSQVSHNRLFILALFIDVGENTSILDTSGNVFVFEQVSHHESMDDWLNTQFCYVSFNTHDTHLQV